MYQYSGIATAVYKRAINTFPNDAPSGGGPIVEDPSGGGAYQLPSWAWIVYLVNFIILLPAFVYIEYTIRQIYPVLAIVENENPPAYEPLALNDNHNEEDAHNGMPKPNVPAGDFGASHTVTASLRGCGRLLRAHGGFRANFRGLSCFIAQGFVAWMLIGIFSASLGPGFAPIATLLASLSLVQFSTAWTHIVMSQPSQLHFWRRLPPFKRTFEATWRPVCIYAAAAEFTRMGPLVLGELLGVKVLTSIPEQDMAAQEPAAIWKYVLMACLTVASSIFLMIPAHIILARVQASLLPDSEETIVPFDRSFQGTIEPAIVGGVGFVSVRDAWNTFSRGAWRRLVKLYIKIYAVSFAFILLVSLFIGAQVVWILSASKEIKKGN